MEDTRNQNRGYILKETPKQTGQGAKVRQVFVGHGDRLNQDCEKLNEQTIYGAVGRTWETSNGQGRCDHLL